MKLGEMTVKESLSFVIVNRSNNQKFNPKDKCAPKSNKNLNLRINVSLIKLKFQPLNICVPYQTEVSISEYVCPLSNCSFNLWICVSLIKL